MQKELDLNANQEEVKSQAQETKNSANDNNNNTNNTSKSQEDEEDVDVSTPCWFYLDSNGSRQGPFSFKELFSWWRGGYFPNDLQVRTVWDADFTQIGSLELFSNPSQKLLEKIEREANSTPTYDYTSTTPSDDTKGSDYQDYTVTGTFNPMTGKYQAVDSASYYASKGLPSDRDSRMMSHYFDFDQYQQQMNEAKEEKKKKQVKGTKKFWKERREKKKRAKLLAEYLAD